MTDAMWDQIAHTQGYESLRVLLCDWIVNQNHSLREVGRRLACDHKTVSNLLDQYGLQRPAPKPTYPDIPLRTLRELSCQELADKYQIPKSRAYRMKLKLKGGYAASDQGEQCETESHP